MFRLQFIHDDHGLQPNPCSLSCPLKAFEFMPQVLKLGSLKRKPKPADPFPPACFYRVQCSGFRIKIASPLRSRSRTSKVPRWNPNLNLKPTQSKRSTTLASRPPYTMPSLSEGVRERSPKLHTPNRDPSTSTLPPHNSLDQCALKRSQRSLHAQAPG